MTQKDVYMNKYLFKILYTLSTDENRDEMLKINQLSDFLFLQPITKIDKTVNQKQISSQVIHVKIYREMLKQIILIFSMILTKEQILIV